MLREIAMSRNTVKSHLAYAYFKCGERIASSSDR